MRRVLLAAALLALAAPGATAQVAGDLHLIQVALAPEPGSAVVELFVPSTVELRVSDLSQTPAGLPDHVTRLTATIVDEDRRGWSVTVQPNVLFTQPGDSITATMSIFTDATVTNPYVTIHVEARMQAFDPSTGETQAISISEATIAAQYAPYYASLVLFEAQPQRVGPYEQVVYPVKVSNLGPYPDKYVISAEADKPGYVVVIQRQLALLAGETGEINLTILTPRDRLWFGGEAGTITIRVESVNDPGVVYTTAAVVMVEGVYVPEYWFPLILLGAVLTGHLAHRASDRMHRRVAEEGRPRRRFTPEEEAELAALKARDPEAYRARREHLVALQKSRMAVWRGERRKRRTIESRIRDRQREETRRVLARERAIEAKRKALARERAGELAVIEAEKRRQQRIEDKVRRKEEKRERKRARKEEKRLAKQLAKERKRKARELARLQKRHAKAEAKAAKEKQARLKELAKEKRRMEKQRKKSGGRGQ